MFTCSHAHPDMYSERTSNSFLQIGSDLNLTLIKLLVLVVSFTGVFRTTCVPEEGEPREPGEFDKPR